MRAMLISHVPDMVYRKTGIRPTRQTIYNWAKRGLNVNGKHITLSVFYLGTRMYTTEDNVIKFLARANI